MLGYVFSRRIFQGGEFAHQNDFIGTSPCRSAVSKHASSSPRPNFNSEKKSPLADKGIGVVKKIVVVLVGSIDPVDASEDGGVGEVEMMTVGSKRASIMPRIGIIVILI